MKAVVYHGIGDIRLDDVPEPKLKADTDAIVRVTASAICGTDLHFVRGTMPGMQPGTILGHEAVGVVEEVGRKVRNLKRGDRVVVPSTIACGGCSYCRAGYHAQCDVANPNGSTAGTAFYGGPKETGPFDGLQAEYARVPFAHVGLVKLPEDLSDDDAITLSDIFPTGYFAAKLAEIQSGDIVAIFGCGPVGLFAIHSARLLGAARIIAVDHVPSRLELARSLGAEVIHFDEEDPVEAIRSLTNGIGADRAIDAVGVDAETATRGPAAKEAKGNAREFQRQTHEVAPKTDPQGDNWHPGGAPGQAITWAVQALAKAGTLSIVGVYPMTAQFFPLGMAMNRNLTIKMGNCNHRHYLPRLVDIVRSGAVQPGRLLSHEGPLPLAIDAYKSFDKRQPGWVKVKLHPAAGT